MKFLNTFLLIVCFLSAAALAQERPTGGGNVSPASQAQVNAGSDAADFLTPLTLKNGIVNIATNIGTFRGTNSSLVGTAKAFTIGGSSSDIGFYNTGSVNGQEEAVFNVSGWKNYWNFGNGFPFLTFYDGINGDYTWRWYQIISSIPGANSQGNQGAQQTTFSPFVGGSAQSLYDLPTYDGAQMHSAMTHPFLGVTTDASGASASNPSAQWTNSAMLTDMATYFRTSSIVNFCTNYGFNPVVYFDDAWEATNRNADGSLAALAGGTIGGLTAPNIFPSGMSNAFYIAHTNGTKVILGIYQTTAMPNQFPGSPASPADTALRSDLNGQNVNSYPSAAGSSGVAYTVPMITPDTVQRDIWTLYTNGADGIFSQDMDPYIEYQGYEHARLASISDAILYPLMVHGGRTFWRNAVYLADPSNSGALSPLTFKAPELPHQLWFGFFGDHFSSETPYYANFVSPDQNPAAVGSEVAMGWAMAYVQNYNYQGQTNWPAGTFPGIFLPGTFDAGWTKANYTNFYSVVGEFNAVTLSGWYGSSWNTNQNVIVTNINFLATWQDTVGGPPKQVINDGTNTLWLHRLSDGFDVLATAQSAASTNYNASLVMPGGVTSNVIYCATNVLSQTPYNSTGLLTNNFVESLGANSLAWVKLTPLRVAVTNSGVVYWTGPVQSQ